MPGQLVVAGEERDHDQALEGHRQLVSDQAGQEGGLALEGKPASFDLLVVLEFDLEQPDHLEGQAGCSGDSDAGMRVGGENLADLTVSNQVALGGLAVAGHDDPVGVPQGQDGGAFRGLHRAGIGREIHLRVYPSVDSRSVKLEPGAGMSKSSGRRGPGLTPRPSGCSS